MGTVGLGRKDMEAIARVMVEKDGGMVTYRMDGKDVDVSFLVDDDRRGVKVYGMEHYDDDGNLLWSADEGTCRMLENECLCLLQDEAYERRKELEDERELRVCLQRTQGMAVCRF